MRQKNELGVQYGVANTQSEIADVNHWCVVAGGAGGWCVRSVVHSVCVVELECGEVVGNAPMGRWARAQRTPSRDERPPRRAAGRREFPAPPSRTPRPAPRAMTRQQRD